ncbi:hypothetical protein BT96DRAFT_1004941 [Gymnopus androsaceus JB14]|uniref:Uncharacterized protein n=1 Tax=Gymnopus androsaceus JB14 TaxID=1447944 RepID=A0A6A4GPB4_9AGAR|nr:hypothetical protein BT96DRAFT_1004941 [Gymnopus androsaceus JB14]
MHWVPDTISVLVSKLEEVLNSQLAYVLRRPAILFTYSLITSRLLSALVNTPLPSFHHLPVSGRLLFGAVSSSSSTAKLTEKARNKWTTSMTMKPLIPRLIPDMKVPLITQIVSLNDFILAIVVVVVSLLPVSQFFAVAAYIIASETAAPIPDPLPSWLPRRNELPGRLEYREIEQQGFDDEVTLIGETVKFPGGYSASGRGAADTRSAIYSNAPSLVLSRHYLQRVSFGPPPASSALYLCSIGMRAQSYTYKSSEMLAGTCGLLCDHDVKSPVEISLDSGPSLAPIPIEITEPVRRNSHSLLHQISSQPNANQSSLPHPIPPLQQILPLPSLSFAILPPTTSFQLLATVDSRSISRAEIERVHGAWAVQPSDRGPRGQTRMSPLNHGYGSSSALGCLTLSPYSSWASALAPSRGASCIYTWLYSAKLKRNLEASLEKKIERICGTWGTGSDTGARSRRIRTRGIPRFPPRLSKFESQSAPPFAASASTLTSKPPRTRPCPYAPKRYRGSLSSRAFSQCVDSRMGMVPSLHPLRNFGSFDPQAWRDSDIKPQSNLPA